MGIFSILLQTLCLPHILCLRTVLHIMTSVTVDLFKAPKCESLHQTSLLNSRLLYPRAVVSPWITHWFLHTDMTQTNHTAPFVPSLTNLFPSVLCLCKWHQHHHHSPCQKPRDLLFPYFPHVISHQVLSLLLLHCLLNLSLSISTVTL